MENIIASSEKIWWIIIFLFCIVGFFCIFVEVFRRKEFKEKYLKFISVSFMFGCGIFSLIFSLMLVWWLALPACIGLVCFARMLEKTEIMLYFRKKNESIEDYKPYQSNIFAMCSSAFVSYMVGVIVQFYFEL